MPYRDPSSLVICLKGMTRGTGTGINLLYIDCYYRGKIPRGVVPFLVIDIALHRVLFVPTEVGAGSLAVGHWW